MNDINPGCLSVSGEDGGYYSIKKFMYADNIKNK